MNRFLLTTAAISVIAGGSAFASGPTVTIGGVADFQLGITDQDNITNDDQFSRGYNTRTDTELHIKVDGKSDNGIDYGAYIELEADVNSDDNTGEDNNNSERGYVYVESKFGRVELGPNTSAAKALKVDASSFARATGGIGGDFYKYIDLDGDGSSDATAFYVLPDQLTDAMPSDIVDGSQSIRSTANKITYYSNRIAGTQLGISFTPDQEERGTANGFSGDKDGTEVATFENVWNVGLNYQGQLDNIGIEASATGEWGDSEDPAQDKDDLRSYALGLNLSYSGFIVGGSWAEAPEAGQLVTSNINGEYWTAGIAYEQEAFATSATYMESEIGNGSDLNAKFKNLSIGADYKLAPGLLPYVEVNFFETKDNDSSTIDNEGTVFLVGTELSF